MLLNPDQLTRQLTLEAYPRSAHYNPGWMMENQMGPNVLWLTEALTQVMDLRPGMRLLDMGCGKALSSIFLAKEFGLQVWANDLWIPATENWQRIQTAGLAEQVFPIQAEAHTLPYADSFFDVVVSLDAYHYFGTDDLYLGSHFAKLVKPGGQIGIVVPGMVRELTGKLPKHLQPYWDWDWYSLHSPTWWKHHWEHSGKVTIEVADLIPDGWQHWLKWLELCKQAGAEYQESEISILCADAGRNIGFTRLVARRKEN